MVTFDYGTVGGMTDRVQSGEVADLVIAAQRQIDTPESLSSVLAATRADLGRTGIGIFVRKDSAKPDIGTVEAFLRTMRAARSIGWNDPAAGAPVSLCMIYAFERPGIAAKMKLKTTAFRQRLERFEEVAREDVEIGFQN